MVCANSTPLPRAEADDAVLSQVRELVLNPDVVEGAIRDAVSALRPAAETVDATRATLTAQVRQLDAELSRLAAAVAAGGDFAALLEAIRDREQRRTALCQRVEGLTGLRQASAFDVRHIERELRARLTDWRGLLGRHTPSLDKCSSSCSMGASSSRRSKMVCTPSTDARPSGKYCRALYRRCSNHEGSRYSR
jgi:hypothetical protein